MRLLTQVVGVPQYLIRDAKGSIPLHSAVNKVHSSITRLLAEAGPIDALLLEDGVGNTALETATRQAFVNKLNAVCNPHISQPSRLQPTWTVQPFDLVKQERELPRLKATIQALLVEGRLTNGTKLYKELTAFAELLEKKVADEKALVIPNEDRKTKAGETEETFAGLPAPSATLAVLTSVLGKRAVSRRLVHLSDVQRSVQASLGQVQVVKKVAADDDDEEKDDTVLVSVLTADYPNALNTEARFSS